MKAIVDCNNFYCSCERLFMPQLDRQPVVVLSNNDGCVISRSDEAKTSGVQMGVPFFEVRSLLQQEGVTWFSSNYELYGDLSWRVMETLRIMMGVAKVEVYSVDEAFIDLDDLGTEALVTLAIAIRERVEQWTGIRVSVGVGPTKTLAKLANRLAKKDKARTRCVMVLSSSADIEAALRKTAVGDLWGIGRRYARRLQEQWGIYDGWQLASVSEEFARVQLGGVIGKRLIRELRGIPSKEMEEERTQKKLIATTRMFGRKVYALNEIKEAIATYLARAAEKLRRQYSAASELSVFIVAHEEGSRYGKAFSHHCILHSPSADTGVLLHKAIELVEALYRSGYAYKKAGVLLSGLVPMAGRQVSLFECTAAPDDRSALMLTIDNINFSLPLQSAARHDSILRFAATGTNRAWKMKQARRSARYTTRWRELPGVH
ncbi:MAG: Y-family DNA polymerase [Sphingomonadales bacterium]